MRCLALAQAWRKRGGEVVFLSTPLASPLSEMIKAEGFAVHEIGQPAGSADDAAVTADVASQVSADWVAIDGYSFGSSYQQHLKATGIHVLAIDDFGHAAPYSADLVLNQNLHASSSLYGDRHSSTRLLLGPRYCLLREEFLSWKDHQRAFSAGDKKVLIAMGGSDPANLTVKFADVLQASAIFVDITVLIGACNPYKEAIEQRAKSSPFPIRTVSTASDVPSLMAAADVAICAAGTIAWELCFLGLPGLLIAASDNQKQIAADLAATGAAINLGCHTSFAPQSLVPQLQALLASAERRALIADVLRKAEMPE